MGKEDVEKVSRISIVYLLINFLINNQFMPVCCHSTFNFSLYGESHKMSHLIQNLEFYKTFKWKLLKILLLIFNEITLKENTNIPEGFSKGIIKLIYKKFLIKVYFFFNRVFTAYSKYKFNK